MSESKSFASLSPTLLARKGAAKPAMRPQLQPMNQFHEATARQMHEDLGWNDMGDDDHHAEMAAAAAHGGAEVVSISEAEAARLRRPAVLDQQDQLAERVSKPSKSRRSALAQGRRAAFTLRLDAERHLALKLAGTVLDKSAQQIVTEALDKLLEDMPEVSSLADKVRKSR